VYVHSAICNITYRRFEIRVAKNFPIASIWQPGNVLLQKPFPCGTANDALALFKVTLSPMVNICKHNAQLTSWYSTVISSAKGAEAR
jgi:hypothetical protein